MIDVTQIGERPGTVMWRVVDEWLETGPFLDVSGDKLANRDNGGGLPDELSPPLPGI